MYHRDYEIREPIEVRILEDHITITSYPGPDRSITLENLRTGKGVARRYRNRRIGDFLKELRLTEGRGTGIPKAIRAMQRNGSPPPIFETDDERSYFIATIPIHPLAVESRIISTYEQVSEQVSRQTLLFDLAKNDEDKLGQRVRVILEFCRSPRDRAIIQSRISIKSRQYFSTHYIFPLIEKNYLAMTDPEHPNSPTQKYYTTDLGIQFLK